MGMEGAMKNQRKTGLGRREFLRTVGVGAATGAMAGAAIPFATEARADGVSDDEKRKPRYKESDEVKTYYRVNRYPS